MAVPTKSSLAFSTTTLESKLRDLNSSMQSIQSVSQWIIQHRKHAKTIVGTWFKELRKASASRKLTLLYVANDVIQNSRRKAPEYKSEFIKALPKALHLIVKDRDETVNKSVLRVVNVWEERHIFENELITKFKMNMSGAITRSEEKTEVDGSSKAMPSPPPTDKPPNGRDPPEVDVLLKLMYSLDEDKSVMQDMEVRQKIANFPSQLYNVDLLLTLKSKESCDNVLKDLNDSLEILTGYNKRLEDELKERKELEEMLDSFIWQQHGHLYKAKEKHKEYQLKMQKCSQVKESLKSHIASLPDLVKSDTEPLAPLPSAGDLFS